jgi:hypothetical protein
MEYAADCHLLKLQRLQNREIRAIGILDKYKPLRELHVRFKVPYVNDYITESFRTQAEVILNHVNSDIRGIGQGAAMHRKYKRLKLDGGQAYCRE